MAGRYAAALIDSISDEKNLDAIKDDFNKIAFLIDEGSDFLNVMTHPLIKLNEKKDLIFELADKLSFNSMFKNFLLLLVDKERIKNISIIKDKFHNFYKEKKKLDDIEISAPVDLSEKEIKSIEDIFSKITGKQISSKFSKDESLIGGLKVKLGNTVYDGSIKNKLELLEAQV
jgi:F-type H+-transporting ATPase subunit delta